MKMSRRTATLTIGSLLTALVLMDASGGAADDVAHWVHPINQAQKYFMPGPAPGGYLSGCIVETSLLAEPSAVALIQPFRTAESVCKPGSRAASVQIVTLNTVTNQLENGPVGYSTDEWPGMSVGPNGQPVFGAHFRAINVNGFEMKWDVTIF